MTLSLDSDVAIELMRHRRPQFRTRMDEAKAAGEIIRISSVVLFELTYGAMRSARADVQLGRVDALVSEIGVEPWTAEDAMIAARIRTDLEKNGTAVGPFDCLIASQAIRTGDVLVTGNVREFIRIPELSLMDWSDPDQPRRLDQETWRARLRRLTEE